MNKQQAAYVRQASKELHESLGKMIRTVRMHTELSDDEFMPVPFGNFNLTVTKTLNDYHRELMDRVSGMILELAKMEDCD